MSLRHAVLGLLYDAPKSGYEIKRFYSETIRNFWNVSDGQLYPTLRRMHGEGLISREVVPKENTANKHVYSITETGRKEFLGWLAKPILKFQEMKEPFVMQMFFFDKLSKAGVAKHLEAQLAMQDHLMQEFQEVEQSYWDQLTPYQKLIAEAAMIFMELRTIWLQRVTQLVEQGQIDGAHQLIPEDRRALLLEAFSQAILAGGEARLIPNPTAAQKGKGS
jgi:PadR family transcriptional regulator AphA